MAQMEKSDHPEASVLARLGEPDADEGGARLAEHLRLCARCRNAAADYRWLERQIGAALAEAADAVPVPRPKWWDVRRRVFAGQPRPGLAWRASVVVGVVLIFCQMLPAVLFPPTAPPSLAVEPAVAPPPVIAAVSQAPGSHGSTTSVAKVATPTPGLSVDGTTDVAPLPTLAPALSPRPELANPKPQMPSGDGPGTPTSSLRPPAGGR